MNIEISYFAQIRRAAGVEAEIVPVTEGATVLAALRTGEHGPEFRTLLFDDTGALRPTLLLLVNDLPAAPDQSLRDGDRISVFAPVAGG